MATTGNGYKKDKNQLAATLPNASTTLKEPSSSAGPRAKSDRTLLYRVEAEAVGTNVSPRPQPYNRFIYR